VPKWFLTLLNVNLLKKIVEIFNFRLQFKMVRLKTELQKKTIICCIVNITIGSQPFRQPGRVPLLKQSWRIRDSQLEFQSYCKSQDYFLFAKKSEQNIFFHTPCRMERGSYIYIFHRPFVRHRTTDYCTTQTKL
jgi:hypothetical protein